MGLRKLIKKFQAAGYDDLNQILGLMHTSYRLTYKIIEEEIEIHKPGYINRILIRLE